MRTLKSNKFKTALGKEAVDPFVGLTFLANEWNDGRKERDVSDEIPVSSNKEGLVCPQT